MGGVTDPGQPGLEGSQAARVEALVWVIVGLAVALRAWQMAGGASLWLDELDVARNLSQRTYAGLFRPLDYGQVAPPILLAVIKALWHLLGRTDWALRLLPFAAAVASVFLFRSLARQLLQGGAVVLATMLFALCVPMIQEAAQLKQYSSDLAIAIALTLVAFQALPADVSRRRLIAAGIAGFVAVFLSNTAVFMVTGLGAALVWFTAAWRPGSGRRVLGMVVAPWAVGAGAATLLSLNAMSPETHVFMRSNWGIALAPLPPWSLADLTWPWVRLRDPFRLLFAYRLSSVFVILELLGFIALWRAHRIRAALLLGPFAVTAAAAVARQYPFADRLVLFLAPAFIIGVAAGAAWIAAAAARRTTPALGAAVLVMACAPALERIVIEHPVYRLEETKRLYQWLGQHRQDGDALFMSLGAVPGYEWYAGRVGAQVADTMIGGCWPESPLRYMQGLDGLRGRSRAWVLLVRTNADLMDATWRYLDSLGVLRDEIELAPSHNYALTTPKACSRTTRTGCAGRMLRLRLYDLSDSTRLARWSADAFAPPLARAYPVGVLSCYYGPVAARRRDAEGRLLPNPPPGPPLPR